MTAEEQALLGLVKLVFQGSTSEVGATVPSGIVWEKFMPLAIRQGMGAVTLDAIEHLPTVHRPAMSLLLQWAGHVAAMEQTYERYKAQMASLAAFYAEHDIKMLLLKGYGCGLCWPRPEHRPVGDIDIYLFGKHQEADALVRDNLGINVHHAYHKHSTFNYHGVEVENHAKFIDDISHKSNIRFEKTLMELLQAEECLPCPIDNVWLPSPTFNALFLLRHTGEHFAANEITLRHVIDVGTLFLAQHSGMDWETVFRLYRQERMADFFNGIATICIEYLGMDASCFMSTDGRFSYTHDKVLADRILADIFEQKKPLPMSTANIDTVGKKMSYALNKSHRWWKNRWKYQLVYNETLIESFGWLAKNRMKERFR